MADYDARFNRLALSATDLKQVTALQKPGEPWPDALIEDYLNILRDLIELADLIDQNAATIIRDIDVAFQEAAASNSRIAKLYGKISEVEKRFNLQPQESSAYQGKLKGLTSKLRMDSNSFFAQKGFYCTLTGNGAAAPTVTNSYNYQSINRTAIGVYQLTFINSTINGVDFASRGVFAHNFTINGSAATDLYSVEFVPASGSVTVYVYQYTIVGPKITKTAYDLQILDTLNVMLLSSEGTLYQAL